MYGYFFHFSILCYCIPPISPLPHCFALSLYCLVSQSSPPGFAPTGQTQSTFTKEIDLSRLGLPCLPELPGDVLECFAYIAHLHRSVSLRLLSPLPCVNPYLHCERCNFVTMCIFKICDGSELVERLKTGPVGLGPIQSFENINEFIRRLQYRINLFAIRLKNSSYCD